MRQCRGAGLAGLAALLLVAAGRAQVQQDPWAETTQGTGISINCSHPNIKITDFIHWYRQLPGRGPAFLVSSLKGSKELRNPSGRLSVAADRRSSALWLARPRCGDAAVYYCALEDTGRGPGTTCSKETEVEALQLSRLQLALCRLILPGGRGESTCQETIFCPCRATEHSQPGRETASGAGTGLSPGAELASEERRGGGGEEVPRLEQ
ncbi:uncharacterized protein LOC132319412 [Gavia stellata]|uniref:uncharacterized protein LOC132319412 n=1 Tax=Gavia stellata TaxID=37040 RepID=UPI00289A3E31|nr:uncharacterized protein LOC132319412 [Gavia stellata]